MNRTQYARLTTETVDHVHAASVPGRDRILLEGYDVNRAPFSVALEGKNLVVDRYDDDGRRVTEAATSFAVDSLYPNKRTYAARTDYDFARLLKAHGGTPTYIW